MFIVLWSILVTGCVIAPIKTENKSEKLSSENFVLKKRLVAVERRNMLLEDENIQTRKTIKEKDAEIENVGSHLKLIEENYKKDIILLKEKYANLNQKFQILSQKSKGEIKALTKLNADIENKLTADIKRLNAEMNNKEIGYLNKIKLMKNQSAKREFELSNDIKFNKDLLGKTQIELDVNKKRIKELSENLKNENEKCKNEQAKFISLREKFENISEKYVSSLKLMKKLENENKDLLKQMDQERKTRLSNSNKGMK